VDTVNQRIVTPAGMDKNFSLSDDTASKWVVYTDGTTRGHNYYVSVAGSENLASVQMNLGNGWVNGVISGDKAVFHQSTPMAVGNLTASFRTTDLAGNVSAVTTQAMEVKDWSAIGNVHTIGAATFDVEETTVYNARYGTNHSLGEFDLYYQDVQKRIKDQQWPNADYPAAQKIDITIVVDMLLTGFDSKYLNTLYVDKNLKHHGLIQAFSRTNRVLNSTKPYGNILDFRQQQDAVDAAIALVSGE
jgi:hypothetical protein